MWGRGGGVVGALFIGQIALSLKQGFQIITVRLDYLPLFGIWTLNPPSLPVAGGLRERRKSSLNHGTLYIFSFLFVGREPTTWPANNCLQIMVCSCAMPSNSVWLQIIFCSCVKETVLFSFLRSLLRENGGSLRFPRCSYRDLSVFSRSIICVSLRLRQIIDLLATDKSRYCAQPLPIIVKYFELLF